MSALPIGIIVAPAHVRLPSLSHAARARRTAATAATFLAVYVRRMATVARRRISTAAIVTITIPTAGEFNSAIRRRIAIGRYCAIDRCTIVSLLIRAIAGSHHAACQSQNCTYYQRSFQHVDSVLYLRRVDSDL
ncbi:hypothetical protein [Paraburkholderia adhaesiva]|uniref:hypothetical protein n=1 Tax=Paraburkholderia adhaesiva TaxID=2883244 RepID=UPI001F2A7F99|nr:hypothetical protein [Paraburkholderia adhaesiva]